MHINSICYSNNLLILTRKIVNIYDYHLSQFDLTTQQFTLLMSIKDCPHLNNTERAKTLGLDRTTISRNIDVLTKNKLLEYGRLKEDKRNHIPKLTPYGEGLLKSAFMAWEVAQNKVETILGLATSQELLHLLQSCVTTLESQ